MPARLSVIIPSHNRADLLRLCLASVLRHVPAGAEVVVVDDGSPDGAVTETAKDFPGVRALRREKQSGFCAAANAGLRTAAHPIVELLNDDTEVEAGWADAALKWFTDPTVAAVAPLVLRRSDDDLSPRIDSAGDRYYLGGVAGKRGHGCLVDGEYLHTRPVFGASASSAFYRREAVLAVGGFPESFGAYFEDVDLSFRLHWAGYRVVYEPAARVWHRVSASYGPPCRRLLEQQARNEERVFWRNLPRGLLLRALPSHLAVLAAKAWRRWREGQLLPFLRGKLGVLGEVAELFRHRRRLHASGGGRDWPSWGVEPHFWA
ncbi:MAG TPA: glycosyltransferase [Planctomycetales bacterium]|nr:glycosyltransferase [Planctomycetales bacterium]